MTHFRNTFKFDTNRLMMSHTDADGIVIAIKTVKLPKWAIFVKKLLNKGFY